MAGGEVCKKLFSRATDELVAPTRLDIPAFSQKACCFKLPALAQNPIEGSDPNKNDKHTVIQKYDKNLFVNVTIFLQKYDPSDPSNIDGWVDIEDLSFGNLGVYYPFGGVGMTDSDGRYKYVAANLDWQIVLFSHGEGSYRFRFSELKVFGGAESTYHLFEFCLKEYMPHRANGTVRFTWYTKGYRGDVFNDEDVWDFTQPARILAGDGWFNQIRLPDSWFGDNKSEYERSYIQYSNGQQVWIQDEQVESYSFHSGMFPSKLHAYIKTEILQADRILVTDYNSKNPNIITDKAVKPNGSYEPSWNVNNLNAMVSVDFVQEYQNRRKRRC